ncbi:MAG: choice-of-anchor Q domain-containing protein, partial [Anaerolineae bacterium]
TKLFNSIVAGNTPGDVYGVGFDSHSVVSQAPLLGPLQSLPAYYPLLENSPAFNRGAETGCLDNLNNLLEHDIRGHPRAGPCDAGSYEGSLLVAKRLTNGLERNKPAHYQVVLTNIQSVELTDITLTDTIPVELNLVPGTVSVNRGVLTQTNDALLWSGSVAYTEPVTITYSALVSESVPLGTVVTNNVLARWQGYPFTTSVVTQLRTLTFMPNVAATHCGDFIEDFQDKEGGWPIVDDDYVMMGYSEMYMDVHYIIQPKKHYYLFMARAPTCLRSNYSVEVQADWENGYGSDIGLVFGLEGNFDYFYLFDINTYQKKYQVLRVTPTEVIQWVPPTYSDAIDGSFFARNFLKVIVFHGALILEINGQRVAVYPGAAVMAAETGSGIFAGDLIYGPMEEADFDNFKVTHLHNDAVVSLSETTAQVFEPGASLSRVRAPQAFGIDPGILELGSSWDTWPGNQSGD